MIECKEFVDQLSSRDIRFYTGVPDSLLKSFCAYLKSCVPSEQQVLAANEGNAVALAAGHFLATGRPAVVYMQNSGLGNTINPLASLADPLVYSIPMILLIGWRGEPGQKDEPQHAKQGLITTGLLDVMGIPYEILPPADGDWKAALDRVVDSATGRSAPAALVVRKEAFASYQQASSAQEVYPCLREEAIRAIAAKLGSRDVVVSTTGMASRELFEFRARNGSDHSSDFLTVGSMGHASQIALGIALSKPDRNVYCLDGDGAVIMHMGGLAVTGALAPANFRHIVLNNGAHDSVGGQPTCGFVIDIAGISLKCGYRSARVACTAAELDSGMDELVASEGPALLEVRICKGHRKDLGRPTSSPVENKQMFMSRLAD